MVGKGMDITNLPTPRRQLWSARRCAVYFAIGVAVFIGVVGWAGAVIQVNPVAPATLVDADVPGSLRVEVDEATVEKFGQPIRVTQAVTGGGAGYRASVSLGEGGLVEDMEAVSEWSMDEPVKVVFAKRSLWCLARKAVGF